MEKYNCIVVLGPTASGKTRMACELAHHVNGEIISADSRQVYKQLDIGTGKDLKEYQVHGKNIAYHLVDVLDPSEQFYLHQFSAELEKAFREISSRKKVPIVTGGTGLYLDALRKDFSLTAVPENHHLRTELNGTTKQELLARLDQYSPDLTNHVDRNSVKRIIRGIEIADHVSKNKINVETRQLPYKPYYIGIQADIGTRKKRISERLMKRLEEGLIPEVESLLKKGLTHTRLELLGLEYKYVSHFLQGKLKKEEMTAQLQTAIFQFAKRQMTWFRKMEREGVRIHWINDRADLQLLASTLSGQIEL